MKRISNLVNKYLVPSEFPPSEIKTLRLKIDLSAKILAATEEDEKKEDQMEDNNNTDEKKMPMAVQDLQNYLTLMLKPNCDSLLARFMAEISTLRLSDARGVDFSFESSLKRLRRGYNIIQFIYTSKVPMKSVISIDGYGILIKAANNLELRFNYETFIGVLLGPLSSTFQGYFRQGGKLRHLGLEDTDCFSILGKFQNFDFATHSDTAKYDIIQVVSFYLSCRVQDSCPLLPIKHTNIVFYKIKHKIQDMATKRFMTVKELFLLAILKSLVVNDAPTHIVERARRILNKSFSASSKLYRVSIMMKPTKFKSSVSFIKKYKDTLRKVILTKRKGTRIFDSMNNAVKNIAIKDAKNQGRILTWDLLMNKKKEEWERIKNFYEYIL